MGAQRLPQTDAFSAREITLPLHPGLTEKDVDYVVEQLDSVLAEHLRRHT
jgi:dTDP-4-amino-4,6-dideoxygalactose transaminase